MFLKPLEIAPARLADLLSAAEAAGRALPLAFPLEATVAVNPFLGQTGEDLATAAARLARVGGVPLARPRADHRADIAAGGMTDDDLAGALAASASPLAPAAVSALKAAAEQDAPAPVALPTVADLARESSGIDWPTVIGKTFGLWASGHFDRGQALWTPAPGRGAYAAWRAWAVNDVTPEIAGLRGFCAHVAEAPDTPDRALLRAAGALGIAGQAAETAFHRLFMDLGGWAQHARWLLWQAELGGDTDETLGDLLAIRLVWEEALLAAHPAIAGAWADTLDAHAEPNAPTSAASAARCTFRPPRPERGPFCRQRSASTCARRSSAGRSRHRAPRSPRSGSRASSACRLPIPPTARTSSRRICRCFSPPRWPRRATPATATKSRRGSPRGPDGPGDVSGRRRCLPSPSSRRRGRSMGRSWFVTRWGSAAEGPPKTLHLGSQAGSTPRPRRRPPPPS